MFNKNDTVFDSELNEYALVELVHGGGFYVLDKSFGQSRLVNYNKPNEYTTTINNDWVDKHGDDGRYSISFKDAEQRLRKLDKQD